jgi:polyisoprenyl-phosphate glycosyltransferase
MTEDDSHRVVKPRNCMQPQISIVVPLFNEEKIFAILIERLNKLMATCPLSIEVVLIDDGSNDNTPFLMSSLALEDKRYQCIFLARNFGHQIALTAGLANANGSEAFFIIDGDLQDPPELLFKFYEYLKAGYEVVYAIRKKRKEAFYKRYAYSIFYRILKNISNIHIPPDSGDFSLISKRVAKVIISMPEQSRFIRGMRSWVGFKQIGVEYERDSRAAGETKYSFKALKNLAYNGIFNFSEFPIKFITNVGFLTIAVVFIYFMYALYKRVFYDVVPEGFTALIFIIMLVAGAQLMALGIIGEYVLRIFIQVKNRPLFTIKQKIVEGAVINE